MGCVGATEMESRTSSYRSATPLVPSFSLSLSSFAKPVCTVSPWDPLSLSSCASRSLIEHGTSEIGTEREGGTGETTLADVVERERVSRKGLFTPLEMWNSCRPPIRRIKSL